jgi:NTE family protein
VQNPPTAAALTATGPPHAPRLGLVLPGGGARGAYQVGVLKAIAEILPRHAPSPFRVIAGTSAGAIISAIVAAHSRHFRQGAVNLERFWRNFHIDQVFRADTRTMLRSGVHWLLALVTGGSLVAPPRSVFDNRPLRETLERHVNFADIRHALAHGHLDALAINASAYRTSWSVAFYECANASPPWQHTWRVGRPATLGLDHLMASAAVPFLFPPVQMGDEYYGDGAMRQVAPLSPAIHLGADRLLIITVRDSRMRTVVPNASGMTDGLTGNGRRKEPSFGQIFGFMLDTLFMDGIQADLERLRRDNQLIASGGTAPGLRLIEPLVITPRDDFGEIAERHANEVPSAVRVLLRTMGADNPGGATLLSYLLFEAGYTRELIALGYRDGMARRDEIQALVRNEPWRATTSG